MSNTKYYRYEKHTILLTKDVYQRLKARGEFGETYSKIVKRLLDRVDELESNRS